MSNILIIDGDVNFCQTLMAELAKKNLHATHSTNLSKGLAMLHVGEFSLVLLGDEASDRNSLDFLSTLREVPSRPEIIVLSRNRDPDTAEAAIRGGAWNFMPKPVNLPRLLVLAERALEYHRERPAKCAPVSLRREGIVGNSRLLQSCLDIVAQAASTDVNVLITGETGTGKELFARAIHANSARAKKPFVVVDCAALPDTLVESMLFGHERGAFTSADNRSEGLIKQADGGTLFLDEVGELPLSAQKVFLRVLEGRSFRPVGGAKEITSNFRLVAATNRDLEAMVRNDTFRRDLFYRFGCSRRWVQKSARGWPNPCSGCPARLRAGGLRWPASPGWRECPRGHWIGERGNEPDAFRGRPPSGFPENTSPRTRGGPP